MPGCVKFFLFLVAVVVVVLTVINYFDLIG